MTIGELIAVLNRLPADHEIAMLTAHAIARPPTVERINAFSGWVDGGSTRGLVDPTRAFLIRPEREIV